MLKLSRIFVITATGIVLAGTLTQGLLERHAAAASQTTNITATYAKPLRQAVRDLGVRSERRAGYQRSLYLHWIDADKDGCNTRYEVLIAEAVRRPTVGAGCWLRGGTWRSYYDGATTSNPSTFDVDHLVPLAEAHDSGGYAWSAETRTRYANDLADPRTLVAVTARSNRTKSDADPAQWLPARGKCRYVREWVAVKLRWSLSVDRAEQRKLIALAAKCPNTVVKVRKAAIRRSSTGIPASSTGPAASTTGVVITQIAYDAPGSDTAANTNGEWVELANTRGTKVVLTGWVLSDASGARYTLPAFALGAGSAVRVHSGSGAPNSGHLYAGWGHRWNNTGDTARLTNAAGATVSTCAYTPTASGTATCR